MTNSITRSLAAPLARRLSLADLNQTLSGLPQEQWLAWTLVHADGFDLAAAANIEGVLVAVMSDRLVAATAALKARLGPAYSVARLVSAHESWVRNLVM